LAVSASLLNPGIAKKSFHVPPQSSTASLQVGWRRREAGEAEGGGRVPDGLGGSGSGPGPPAMENLTMAKAIQKIAMNAAENTC
jgi:hypothetical protein